MKPLSEIERRVAREQWHVEMAYAATCEIVAGRHLEFARRCADYSIAADDIEPRQCEPQAVARAAEIARLAGELRSYRAYFNRVGIG